MYFGTPLIWKLDQKTLPDITTYILYFGNFTMGK